MSLGIPRSLHGALTETMRKIHSAFAAASPNPHQMCDSAVEEQLRRTDLAAQIKGMLEDAEFYGIPVNERQADVLIGEGQGLLFRAAGCAWNPKWCAVFAEAF